LLALVESSPAEPFEVDDAGNPCTVNVVEPSAFGVATTTIWQVTVVPVVQY